MDYVLTIVPSVAEGLQVTLKIFVITIVFSLPLGILMAMARLAPLVPLRKFMAAYIYLMRGTPLMLQILFIYYGLPFIQSIDRGQYEGAKVLGMTYGQTMRRIILPQVIKRVLPPVANETINLLKDTSLVYVLAMNDILRITRSIVQRDFDTTAFVVAAVFYLIFTFVLTRLFMYLEKRFNVYEG